MKTALINASPKAKGSGSEIILNDLKRSLNHEITELKLRKITVDEKSLKELESCDTWVIAFPLYIDGIPSHLLNCLIELEKNAEGKKIYAVANCGFYEGEQNRNALQVLINWTKRSNSVWCGAVGIGAGGCITTFTDSKPGKSPKKTVEAELDKLAISINEGDFHKTQYVSMGLPKKLYKLAAEFSWRLKLKSNGGKIKDLYKQY